MVRVLHHGGGLSIHMGNDTFRLLPGEYTLCKSGMELVLPVRLSPFAVVEFGISFADPVEETCACSAVIVGSTSEGDSGGYRTSLLFLNLSDCLRRRIASAIL